MVSTLSAESISFEQSSVFSLHDISLHVPVQRITSIIGPNGSGKSTFLRIMTNLLSPQQGVVSIDGKEIASMSPKVLARTMTMLSQTQNHELDLTVRELVSHGRLPHRKWYEKLTKEDGDRIDWAISITHLEHLQHQSVKSLSGGERQRAWIAMAIVQSPEILVLDEPTTYLDISHQLELMELVRYLNATLRMTVVMVLHDINQAAKYSDYLVVMDKGKLLHSGHPRDVINETLFRDVFSIHARIHEEDGVPYFTPIRLVERP